MLFNEWSNLGKLLINHWTKTVKELSIANLFYYNMSELPLHGEWSDCTSTCGLGIRIRDSCRYEDSRLEVEYCEHGPCGLAFNLNGKWDEGTIGWNCWQIPKIPAGFHRYEMDAASMPSYTITKDAPSGLSPTIHCAAECNMIRASCNSFYIRDHTCYLGYSDPSGFVDFLARNVEGGGMYFHVNFPNPLNMW